MRTLVTERDDNGMIKPTRCPRRRLLASAKKIRIVSDVLRDGATSWGNPEPMRTSPAPWRRIPQPHRESGQGRRLADNRGELAFPAAIAPRPPAGCAFLETGHGTDLALTGTPRYHRGGSDGSPRLPGTGHGRPRTPTAVGSGGTVRKRR